MSAPRCPCGAGDYSDCCGRYHAGTLAPDNALVMMRSRYSAYVLKLEDYLLATWHPDTRPDRLNLESEATKWLGLTIKNHVQSDPAHAIVEFIARYKIGGRAHRLHEVSRFVFENWQWLYVDGEFPKN